MTRRIGGPLDLHALDVLSGRDRDYVKDARANEPDADGVRREALRLLGEGWDVDTVAMSLRVAREQVQAWAAQP